MLIDTHCHLDFPQFDSDREAVIKRSQDNKIRYIINVGSNISTSFKSKALSDKFSNIFFAIGFHPHFADEFDSNAVKKLTIELYSKKLVAFGEVGLDYFKSKSSKAKQKEVFLMFINLAKQFKLPLIIHCRDSHQDTYEILKDQFDDFKNIVFHCFSGSFDFFEKCINLGAMFSFAANITFPKALRLRKIVENASLDNIMVETDSPYLAPQRFRGQRNEPSYVHFVAQEIARVKNIPFKQIADITTQNAIRFFNLNEY